MKQTLISFWQRYAGRIVAWALGPVLLWATPVIVEKAQAWFGYHLTQTQVNVAVIAAMSGIVVKLGIWLVNNGRIEKVVAEAEKVAAPFLSPGFQQTPVPVDDEPADVPGVD